MIEIIEPGNSISDDAMKLLESFIGVTLPENIIYSYLVAEEVTLNPIVSVLWVMRMGHLFNDFTV